MERYSYHPGQCHLHGHFAIVKFNKSTSWLLQPGPGLWFYSAFGSPTSSVAEVNAAQPQQYIPAQLCVLQSSVSWSSPTHVRPLKRGRGFVHVRNRRLWPAPHVTVQSPHDDQSAQLPWTDIITSIITIIIIIIITTTTATINNNINKTVDL